MNTNAKKSILSFFLLALFSFIYIVQGVHTFDLNNSIEVCESENGRSQDQKHAHNADDCSVCKFHFEQAVLFEPLVYDFAQQDFTIAPFEEQYISLQEVYSFYCSLRAPPIS